MQKIFDGHNDVLLRLVRKNEADGGVASFLEGDGEEHLDLPRSRAGGFAGGMFAVFVSGGEPDSDRDEMMQAREYDLPLPERIGLTQSQAAAIEMIALLHRIVRRSGGRVRLCRTTDEIRSSVADGALATVLHIEGSEPIDRDLKMLEVLYQAGLRSLGIVWSRPTIFGHGVPFRFPGSPDAGPGLTDEGKALVKACNELGVIIDLSHLTEQGFWDVANFSAAPLVATHSNAHALCRHTRNLTDRQLAAIRDSEGMVGINFAACFLRTDGRMLTDTPIETIVRHADYLIEQVGVDGVGFGSDFDGAKVPDELGSVEGLPKLIDAFRHAGYDDDTLRKLCFDNWMRVLERSWGA
jgi:membrane dipeptidase